MNHMERHKHYPAYRYDINSPRVDKKGNEVEDESGHKMRGVWLCMRTTHFTLAADAFEAQARILAKDWQWVAEMGLGGTTEWDRQQLSDWLDEHEEG